MSRAAQTLSLAFGLEDEALEDQSAAHAPIFVEYLRDRTGVDTHSSRRTASYLRKTFPSFDFEERFSENDVIWKSTKTEHDESIAHRARIFLENLFLRRSEVYIVIAAHEAIIQYILQVVGHRPFLIPNGHFIPLVIKADWIKSRAPKTESEEYTRDYVKDMNCSYLSRNRNFGDH